MYAPRTPIVQGITFFDIWDCNIDSIRNIENHILFLLERIAQRILHQYIFYGIINKNRLSMRGESVCPEVQKATLLFSR